eukprot:648506-Pyramimonas_sp.AAC.1
MVLSAPNCALSRADLFNLSSRGGPAIQSGPITNLAALTRRDHPPLLGPGASGRGAPRGGARITELPRAG